MLEYMAVIATIVAAIIMIMWLTDRKGDPIEAKDNK